MLPSGSAHSLRGPLDAGGAGAGGSRGLPASPRRVLAWQQQLLGHRHASSRSGTQLDSRATGGGRSESSRSRAGRTAATSLSAHHRGSSGARSHSRRTPHAHHRHRHGNEASATASRKRSAQPWSLYVTLRNFRLEASLQQDLSTQLAPSSNPMSGWVHWNWVGGRSWGGRRDLLSCV